jgi:hypothetical protein
LWVGHQELAKEPTHPFHNRVKEWLEAGQFDEFAENDGRPSLTPGIYFRLLLVTYSEELDSQRGNSQVSPKS